MMDDGGWGMIMMTTAITIGVLFVQGGGRAMDDREDLYTNLCCVVLYLAVLPCVSISKERASKKDMQTTNTRSPM
jgi:hypothetical protein